MDEPKYFKKIIDLNYICINKLYIPFICGYNDINNVFGDCFGFQNYDIISGWLIFDIC